MLHLVVPSLKDIFECDKIVEQNIMYILWS